jgi:hypothetical protein
MPRALYQPQSNTEATESFFDSLYSEATESNDSALDSVVVVAAGLSKSRLARSGSGDQEVPASVQAVIERLPNQKDRERVLDSVVVGMSVYKREHGQLPTADVLEAALHQGMAAAMDNKDLYNEQGNQRALDSVGTTEHADPLGAQPNRVVVAITSAIAEAFPAATYLPADIGSNWARLAIVSHLAGSAWGGYAAGDIMDGISVGQPFISSERTITLTSSDQLAYAGAFAGIVGGSTAVQVLRGRTIVYVNGFPCAFESPTTPSSATTSPITGFVTLGSTQYSITGGIVTNTGVISLAFSPALPAGTIVGAEAYIDFEAAPALSPEVITQATTYNLYATPWRARVRNTIDSKTQYANELGLDMASEALIAVRNQFAMERHYNVLRKAVPLASTNTRTWDMSFQIQEAHKTRAMMWQDFQAVLGQADQQMAEDTMDHGITHLYVGKVVQAQLLSMPQELFEPSGLVARPGIYRLGTLFGRYEVYYNPRATENATAGTSQILAIGRSTQVARCPFVLGDAVPPTYMPLAFSDDFRFGSGFYARNFTSVNPHQPSSKGVAIINIIDMI